MAAGMGINTTFTKPNQECKRSKPLNYSSCSIMMIILINHRSYHCQYPESLTSYSTRNQSSPTAMWATNPEQF